MIFDKFYRGKDQRFLVRGTGMGLPIGESDYRSRTRGIDFVTSRLGHGSVFSFACHSIDPVCGSPMNAAAILVVDDEPQIRRVLRSTLQQGLCHQGGHHGEEAVEAVRRNVLT
jgi:hypothetical protein